MEIHRANLRASSNERLIRELCLLLENFLLEDLLESELLVQIAFEVLNFSYFTGIL